VKTVTTPAKLARSAGGALSDTPPRWEERSQNRVLEAGRDQILDRSRRLVEAAYELLDEVGLEGLTIRAVLEKTRLSRRAFYERFEGKDDLMLAVFEQTIRLAANHYRAQVATLADPMSRMNLIVICIVMGQSNLQDAGRTRSNRRGAAMSREHLRLAESRPEELQAALHPLIALIAEQLSSGMAVGLVRRGAPERLAALLYNLVSTTVHTELLAHEGAQPDRARQSQLAADIWEFCRRAIAAS
jgi:AcrR family transcriptional regulator